MRRLDVVTKIYESILIYNTSKGFSYGIRSEYLSFLNILKLSNVINLVFGGAC